MYIWCIIVKPRHKFQAYRSMTNLGPRFQAFDMVIHLLTAAELTAGTVHIYTRTIHRTTKWNRIYRTEHI